MVGHRPHGGHGSWRPVVAVLPPPGPDSPSISAAQHRLRTMQVSFVLPFARNHLRFYEVNFSPQLDGELQKHSANINRGRLHGKIWFK